MAVVLKPGGQAMLVADLTKTAHIVVGHLIGDKPPEIPKETVGHVLAADHHTTHDRDERHRIVAVGRNEILDQIVGPVLASCLVAVLHTDLERLSVLGRDPLQYLAEIVVKVCAYVLLAHLVRLKSGSLHRRRGAERAGRKHGRPHDHPVACRNIPDERPVFGHIGGYVLDLTFRNTLIVRLIPPHVGIPHRMRGLPHL